MAGQDGTRLADTESVDREGHAAGAVPLKHLLKEDEVLAARIDVAVDRCKAMIRWYEGKLRCARICYRLFQTAVILLSGITPILVLTDLGANPFVPANMVQALPATVAAIAAALMSSYKWREDWVRYAVAAEMLRSELNKYRTRSTEHYAAKLPDVQALDNFVFRTEALAISEVSEWRNQFIDRATESPDSSPRRQPLTVGKGHLNGAQLNGAHLN